MVLLIRFSFECQSMIKITVFDLCFYEQEQWKHSCLVLVHITTSTIFKLMYKKLLFLKCSWARNLNITANLQLFGIHFLVTFIIGWFWITREVTSCDFFKFSIIVWLKSTLGTSKRYSFVFNDSDYKSVIFVPLQFTVYSTLMAIYSNFEYTSNGNSNNSMHETDNH